MAFPHPLTWLRDHTRGLRAWIGAHRWTSVLIALGVIVLLAPAASGLPEGVDAAMKELKAVLSGDAALEAFEAAELVAEESVPEAEDVVAASMAARGKQGNLSFFAFTATPKAKTLEDFGTLGDDQKYHPFHTYSMRQAIEGLERRALRGPRRPFRVAPPGSRPTPRSGGAPAVPRSPERAPPPRVRHCPRSIRSRRFDRRY